jgi:hypothetical protein
VEAVLVEPVDPRQGGEFEVVDASPGPVAANALELVEPDQGLGLGVVVGVPDRPDRGDRSRVVESGVSGRPPPTVLLTLPRAVVLLGVEVRSGSLGSRSPTTARVGPTTTCGTSPIS